MRPAYVGRGGDLSLAQPIQNSRVRSYTWLLDADWHALDALTHRAFTAPSGGAVTVRPLLPMVAVVCADIGHGQSDVAPDHDKGWARERDLGFWVPVARGRDDGGHFHVDQVGWYQPYLFVDNAAGVVTGRETYGFSKNPGVCRMPTAANDRARFAVDALIFERFGPDSQARVAELFRLERSGDGLLGTLESSFDNVLEAFLKVQARLLLRVLRPSGLPLPTLELFRNLYDQLTQGLVQMLFLKQFRAVDDPRYACYQAIVEAACDLNGWHGGGFLDEHVLTIHAADSHPIAADLGLPSGPIETGWGFWAEYDFKVLPGTVLWEAGGNPVVSLPSTMSSDAGTQRRGPAAHPREIGGYEIVAPLGRGGMGVVYRARDPATGASVAVKTVLWAGEGALAAIRREIIALSGIRHPGVVKVLAEGVLDGRPWYAMELLEGRSLRQRLAELWQPRQPAIASHTTADAHATSMVAPAPTAVMRGPVRRSDQDTEPPPFGLAALGTPAAVPDELREIVELIAAMCEPLAHVHADGIVHRDLTPDNVIVRPDGKPVLVDFGLAAAFRRGGREALSVGGTIVGTSHYMAPEQIRGEVVDARADLYSLGCIMYEALTGRPPYLGASPAGILAMHLYDQPLPPSAREPTVPLWLDSLVLALLAKEPRNRIGYAGDVAALIRRALGVPVGPDAPAYIYRPRMVGRGDEIERFSHAIVRTRDGTGGVVLVRGCSGVGKTRLAVELATMASADGMRVVTAECPPVAGNGGRGQSRVAPLAPLKPFLLAVADRCLEHGTDETLRLLGERGRVLATYQPALGRLPGVASEPAPAALTVEGTRARLFQYLRETLAAAATNPPLVLLIDDVQWADELTLRFLLSLRSDFFAATPLMIVATQRSEENNPLVGELARAPSTDVIDLQRLDGDGVRAMVADMLALPEVPAALVESLVGDSDGVPFHVGEYLRAAVEDGILTRRPGSLWTVADAAAAAPLPTSLAELLRHRLDRLGAGGRTLAALAAVLGREFDAELLADLTGAPAAVIDDAVRDMVRRHIFEEASEGKLRFGHDKIREAAYDELGDEARKRAHRVAARALEQRASSTPSHDLYPVLAHHWSIAEEPSKAVEFLEKAGGRALEVGGYQDAVDFLRRALVVADRSGGVEERRRGRWHRWLGEASWGLGDVDGCGEHFAAALAELDRPLPSTTRGWLADAGRRLAGQVAGGWLRGSLGAGAGDPDAAEASLAASRLTYRYYHAGENLAMVAMTLRAVDLADRADAEAKVAHPYQQIGYLAGLFRFPRVAERYFARSHQRAIDTNDPANVGVTRYTRGIYLIGDARVGEAQRLCEEAVDLLRAIDNPQEMECALATLAHAEHCLGRFGDALARTQELHESARARNNVMHEAWGAYTMARELLALGFVDDADALLVHAEPLAAEAGDKASLVILVGLRALAATRRGDPDRARATIDRWIDMTRGATPTVYSLGHGYAAVAEAALDLYEQTLGDADRARARKTIAHAWRYAALFPVGRAAAFVLEARGQRIRGRRRLAAALARSALDRAAGAPLPYEAALAHRELAACGVTGPVDHAAEAAAIFARIGQTGV